MWKFLILYSLSFVVFATNPKVILVAEDSEPTQWLIKVHFERAGYQVEMYPDAEKALAAFKADPAKYSILFTDYDMPIEGAQDAPSGVALAREVLKIRKLPVFLHTTHTEDKIDNLEHLGLTGLPGIGIEYIAKGDFKEIVKRFANVCPVTLNTFGRPNPNP